jgi:hypothetical protein
MFGISDDGLEIPENVTIKVCYEQGQYIKHFPLHSSQQIIEEDRNNMIFELSIFLSWDFIKELLSWGPEMEVIQPLNLRERMKILLKETLNKY